MALLAVWAYHTWGTTDVTVVLDPRNVEHWVMGVNSHRSPAWREERSRGTANRGTGSLPHRLARPAAAGGAGRPLPPPMTASTRPLSFGPQSWRVASTELLACG